MNDSLPFNPFVLKKNICPKDRNQPGLRRFELRSCRIQKSNRLYS